MRMCGGTPGMGVNLSGESPVCEDEGLKVGGIPTVTPIDKTLAEGNCGRVTDRGEEAGRQTCEATNRNRIQGRSGQASVPCNTKPSSSIRAGKCGACAGTVHVLIRGDLTAMPVAGLAPGTGPGRESGSVQSGVSRRHSTRTAYSTAAGKA
jgi:hypothetical protein